MSLSFTKKKRLSKIFFIKAGGYLGLFLFLVPRSIQEIEIKIKSNILLFLNLFHVKFLM